MNIKDLVVIFNILSFSNYNVQIQNFAQNFMATLYLVAVRLLQNAVLNK
jgi:hypothetical protein